MSAKKIIVPTAILTVIVLVVTTLLVVTNNLTKDKIAEIKAASDDASRQEVLADADGFEEKTVDYDGTTYTYYEATNGAGYVFTTSYKGYGGAVEVMTGIDADGSVTGIKLTDHDETPGLGAKAAGTDDFGNTWRGQFVGRTAGEDLQVAKDGGDIDAIAGATITSRAVTHSVDQALKLYEAVRGGAN